MDNKEFQEVVKSNQYVLIDFYATWCMPCKMQSQILTDIKDKNIDNLSIVKIDVDNNEDLVSDFNIVSVPTLLLYKDGEVAKRYVGIAKEEDIIGWIK